MIYRMKTWVGARGSFAPWFYRVLAVDWLDLPARVRGFSEFSGQFGCMCKFGVWMAYLSFSVLKRLFRQDGRGAQCFY
jgi:hypothetical protein